MNYKNIPSVIFTDPEVAISGYTEDMCKELKIDYFVKKCSMNYSSLYTILNPEQKGICKLIFDKNEVIIGAELVGNGSSEMIFVLSDMIERKETIETIKNKIYPHPSCIEIIKETIGQ